MAIFADVNVEILPYKLETSRQVKSVGDVRTVPQVLLRFSRFY